MSNQPTYYKALCLIFYNDPYNPTKKTGEITIFSKEDIDKIIAQLEEYKKGLENDETL